MTKDMPFSPDWLSPPGETIATILKERGVSPEDFARSIEQTATNVRELIAGRFFLTDELAHRLANTLGASESFWTKRESRYRQELERLRREASAPQSQAWLNEIPAKEMVDWRWVSGSSDRTAMIASLFQFFGVTSVGAWRDAYKDILQATAFRTSPTFESQPGAVAAWLRKGELAASSIKCNRWNPQSLLAELHHIRGLTREKNPSVFLPELTRKCAACGVAVVTLRAPRTCRASGASRFLSSSRPLLMLSFRYLSDDHFWFTFFHEAAHLILHSDIPMFLEGDDRIVTSREEEANAFALNVLIPREHQQELLSLPRNGVAIIRFAKRLGVSPGIVAGQLQHNGLIPYNHFNNLRRYYEWANE